MINTILQKQHACRCWRGICCRDVQIICLPSIFFQCLFQLHDLTPQNFFSLRNNIITTIASSKLFLFNVLQNIPKKKEPSKLLLTKFSFQYTVVKCRQQISFLLDVVVAETAAALTLDDNNVAFCKSSFLYYMALYGCTYILFGTITRMNGIHRFLLLPSKYLFFTQYVSTTESTQNNFSHHP